MIICKEIEDYIAYANAHPGWINTERWQMINNITKPLLERTDIYFDDKQYRDCLAYVESNYYGLFPFQKYLYAHCFFYKNDVPVFSKFVIVMGRGNGKDGLIMPLTNFFQTPLYGVKGYNIDIVANAEDQAQDSFNVVYDMLTEKNRVKPKWKGKFAVTKELIIGTATKSRLKYNTSNAKTKDGHNIGFNLGYGFGDTSAASENMFFFDKEAYKLDDVVFNIPKDEKGKHLFLKKWTFKSQKGDIDLVFHPIIDRYSNTNALIIQSNQHQVFGYFSGTIEGDGKKYQLENLIGFAEMVKNRW